MPRSPSQKSIELWRSAPTRVMWWTPCVWITRMSVLYQLRLVVAPLERPEGDDVDPGLHDEHGADPLTDRVRDARVSVGLDYNRQGWILLHARAARLDQDVAADVRSEFVHDLADRRREDVDAADDQHVVGAADAADARAGTAACARACPPSDVVASAEAQERRGLVLQVRQDELASGFVLQWDRGCRVWVDQLGMDEAACAEVHPVLVLALAPKRDADVADPHRLCYTRAPCVLELLAERGLAAARLAGDQHATDARRAELLREIGRVRRRGHDRVGLQRLEGAKDAVGVAGADRNVRQSQPVEARKRGPCDERPGVVGGDDPLSGRDSACAVAARRARDPVVQVGGRERD